MRNYIFPIIKRQKENKQSIDIRIPLYKRAPENMPLPVLPINKDIKDDKVDPCVVDFNIDGNIVKTDIRV